ncbi:peptide deformylase [Patescibacteria group bacterium]|nr:peptide deformylase [Patescibacteria group bacterium]MBU0964459.1 peptide deformylase [Patescibacteria group bacterium]
MLNIITNPHPALRQKAKEVDLEEIPKLHQFLNDMAKIMLKKDGIGLAANQVDILKRIIIVNTKDGPLALINPKLLRKSFKKEEAEEGCLSVPDVFGMVKRNYSLTVKAYTKDGQEISIKATGLFARVLQHEVDHINGILFIDKAKNITKGKPRDEQDKL